MSTQLLGNYGEEHACRYLQDKGYKILEKNFRNRMGEIDLIAQDKHTVCFIEVKTRKSLHCGQPYESVHPHKQRKIVQVALTYLKYRYRTVEVLSRFDVISIYYPADGIPELEHIVNAFDLTYLSH
ncbi:MAG: YraN family protein [Candidatus Omnitrophica bacterium]|nr:YraN family protein [Candidatus Omnitrophota bacterium]